MSDTLFPLLTQVEDRLKKDSNPVWRLMCENGMAEELSRHSPTEVLEHVETKLPLMGQAIEDVGLTLLSVLIKRGVIDQDQEVDALHYVLPAMLDLVGRVESIFRYYRVVRRLEDGKGTCEACRVKLDEVYEKLVDALASAGVEGEVVANQSGFVLKAQTREDAELGEPIVLGILKEELSGYQCPECPTA